MLIIQSAQVLLQKINPLIEGFQRPTLGPVRNFSLVSSEFVQILHTRRDYWVCISTIGCSTGIVKLFDSLSHDIISQEVEDQAQSLLADSFKELVYAPVQQQTNARIVDYLELLLQQVLCLDMILKTLI